MPQIFATSPVSDTLICTETEKFHINLKIVFFLFAVQTMKKSTASWKRAQCHRKH